MERNVQSGDALLPRLSAIHKGIVQRSRRLSGPCQVLFELGDVVKPDDVLARGQIGSTPVVVPVAINLGVKPAELDRYLQKNEGERVRVGELLAQKKGALGLGGKDCLSPIDGVISFIGKKSGEFVIEPNGRFAEVISHVHGKVVGISETEGAVVECTASVVQGLAGYGPDAHGPLRLLTQTRGEEIRPELITGACARAVIAGGHIGLAALARAKDLQVAGIIVGGISSDAYLELGRMAHGSGVVVIEGFGCNAMSEPVYQILKELQGETAAVFPATFSPNNGLPEVVISLPSTAGGVVPKELRLEIGAVVRIVGGRKFGESGVIVGLPSELVVLESGVATFVAKIELADDSRIDVPIANIELIG